MTKNLPPYWQVLSPNQPADLLELSKILLTNRKISDSKEFFHPQPPEKITLEQVNIDRAKTEASIERLLKAREKNESVVVFGDYDADGISATAIVWQTLHQNGWKVTPFIPSRSKHGYGLSQESLEEILAVHKPTLILTVDNGIVANKEVRFLKERGVDVILTDHHQPGLNKQGELDYPDTPYLVHTTQLCGTTVAWMLMRELSSHLKLDKKFINQQLDLCAIATIADQVPLFAENRSFAWHGLKQLEITNRVGLLALFDQAKQDPAKLTGGTIGFVLAPRINAMGRLADGMDALRLLCTNSASRAQILAEEIEQVNKNRKDLTYDLLQNAISQAKTQKSQKLIFITGDDYHEGVIGLVAGRLTEMFHRPSIVVGTGGKVAKASGRSVEGVNITDLLRKIEDMLLSVGGHPMAAGFSAEIEKVEQVGEALQELASNLIEDELLIKATEVDCVLPPNLLDISLGEMLEEMEPFGKANSKPFFVLADMEVTEIASLGKDGRHLKIMLSHDDLSKPIKALWWGKGERNDDFAVGSKVNCLVEVTLNHWNGNTTAELRLKGVVAAA